MGISVEVMDTTHGRAAAGVQVALFRESHGQWHEQALTNTDDDGQAAPLVSDTQSCRYRLALDLDHYFAGFGTTPFQSRIEVVFRVFRPGDRVRLLVMITSSSCNTHMILSGNRGDARNLPEKPDLV